MAKNQKPLELMTVEKIEQELAAAERRRPPAGSIGENSWISLHKMLTQEIARRQAPKPKKAGFFGRIRRRFSRFRRK